MPCVAVAKEGQEQEESGFLGETRAIRRRGKHPAFRRRWGRLNETHSHQVLPNFCLWLGAGAAEKGRAVHRCAWPSLRRLCWREPRACQVQSDSGCMHLCGWASSRAIWGVLRECRRSVRGDALPSLRSEARHHRGVARACLPGSPSVESGSAKPWDKRPRTATTCPRPARWTLGGVHDSMP